MCVYIYISQRMISLTKMDVHEEEEMLLLVLLLRRRRLRRERKVKRKVWVKKMLTLRKKKGAFANLVKEMSLRERSTLHVNYILVHSTKRIHALFFIRIQKIWLSLEYS